MVENEGGIPAILDGKPATTLCLVDGFFNEQAFQKTKGCMRYCCGSMFISGIESQLVRL